MDAPSITDWISAVGTAVIGLLGFFITGWQWRVAGFVPKMRVRVDHHREAIEIVIVNRGRAAGIVDQVDIIAPSGQIIEGIEFEDFPDSRFKLLRLPALASMRIVLQTPENRTFPKDAYALIGIGKARPKRRRLKPTPPHVGLFGLSSVLPPGTFPS
ncbi:hypothetical protein [Nonomuraea helvata]|uniref:Uncharacterized protein n=1 Tax=Nonomuraea helvata TaxID=37484 RepID=A0ABV5S548_9ACTN